MHVSTIISTKPNRRDVITKIAFRQILIISTTSSDFFKYITTTVVSYFSINTGSAEREAEIDTASIYKFFLMFRIYRLLFYADGFRKPINVPDPANCPTDLA